MTLRPGAPIAPQPYHAPPAETEQN
jgi:hypothetical protein